MGLNIRGSWRSVKLSELGVVWNAKGDKIVFGLFKGAKVCFGQIVRVLSNKRTFYARVNDTESASTLATEDRMKELEGREGFGPYSVYRNVEGGLFLERIGESKPRAPTFNPTYGDKVFEATIEDYELLRLGGDLELGSLRSGKLEMISVGLNVEALPKHMGMFGMTGSGKTNAELLLNARIIDNSKTVGVIFDFHDELLEGKNLDPPKGLIDHPLFHTRVRYYSVDKIKIGIQSIWTSHLNLLFSKGDLTPAQLRLARKLDRMLGRDWISKVKDEGIPTNTMEKQAKSTVNALLRKLEDLSEDIFVPNSSRSFVNEVVQNVKNGVTCLIDLSELGLGNQKRIAGLVAFRLAHEYQRMWQKQHEEWRKLPKLLITLEEAHEFLDPDPNKKTFFCDLALKYRKYNVGLNVVTPRPSRIDLNIFAELWTKLIMKTTLTQDRQFLTKNTPYLEYGDVEVKLLDVGEALLVSEPQLRFAVPMKVTHYPDYLRQEQPKDYTLPSSKPHEKMDERIKRISEASGLVGTFQEVNSEKPV